MILGNDRDCAAVGQCVARIDDQVDHRQLELRAVGESVPRLAVDPPVDLNPAAEGMREKA